MTKKVIFSAMIICFLMLNVNVALFAQISNNEERLVGTWTNLHDNSTITFNADGSVTGFRTIVEGLNASGAALRFSHVPSRYAVADDQIVLFSPNDREALSFIFDYRISNDGRTLILSVQSLGTRAGFAFRRN